jgi:hypothetical protein
LWERSVVEADRRAERDKEEGIIDVREDLFDVMLGNTTAGWSQSLVRPQLYAKQGKGKAES